MFFAVLLLGVLVLGVLVVDEMGSRDKAGAT
jgi:hypothetical protein